jgi:hypothetical protein
MSQIVNNGMDLDAYHERYVAFVDLLLSSILVAEPFEENVEMLRKALCAY